MLGVPVAIGGDNLPSPFGIGLNELPNIGGGGNGPPGPPGSGITGHSNVMIEKTVLSIKKRSKSERRK